MAKQYQDETWLKEKYVDERKSSTQMAEIANVSETTILDWMERHGIERRSQVEAQITEGKQNDPKWLREQYIENRRSMRDIGEEVGMSPSGIKKCLERHGIDRRGPEEHHRYGPCSYITDTESGYVQVSSKCNYEKDQCNVHQLVAIFKGANPYKVFSNGRYHIHHKNRIPWDNRPDNLELKSAQVHTREHSVDEKRHIPDEYNTDRDKTELLSDLRNLIMDWRELDSSEVDMCADELDALLAD